MSQRRLAGPHLIHLTRGHVAPRVGNSKRTDNEYPCLTT